MFSFAKLKQVFHLKPFVLSTLFLCLWTNPLAGHSTKARFHILIDTDGALDDLRAISLFLASPEYEILAITTSDGALSPKQGLVKVRALLKDFGHEGIPTAPGEEVQEKAPAWRSFCEGIRWGDEETVDLQSEIHAVELTRLALENEAEPVIAVCLGGLTNIASAIKGKPQIKDSISKILWYNDGIDPLSGTNYEIDRSAARDVISAGIPTEVISNSGENAPAFNAEMLNSIASVGSPYGKKIAETHSENPVLERVKSNHLKLWDDLLPAYLLYPDSFECRAVREADRLKLFAMRNVEVIETNLIDILNSRNNVKSLVFDGFPDAPELFADDVQPFMKTIIEKYGMEEWRIGVLTNEMHGHLGIYAIIGAKMGLRARQHFNVGVDDISIISYAGKTPPLSCMNDGLQLSTGGTVGHGLFSLFSEPPHRPEAVFTFNGKTIRMKLKEPHWQKVKGDIKKGVDLYGLGTEEYWKYVRELALQYWLEMDKAEIFNLEIEG
jgi:pyrimidine-specific ribonucleoside hydrolase